jgi:hypothetical protein
MKHIRQSFYIFFALSCLVFFVTQSVLAAPAEGVYGPGAGAEVGDGLGAGEEVADGPGVGTPVNFVRTGTLMNPLDGITSITGFFLAILDILLVFAIPFVVFFIIYAGFMYVTARGDTGKIQTAHNALLYAIIGGLLILGARLILAVIQGTVDEFISLGGNFWIG